MVCNYYEYQDPNGSSEEAVLKAAGKTPVGRMCESPASKNHKMFQTVMLGSGLTGSIDRDRSVSRNTRWDVWNRFYPTESSQPESAGGETRWNQDEFSGFIIILLKWLFLASLRASLHIFRRSQNFFISPRRWMFELGLSLKAVQQEYQ